MMNVLALGLVLSSLAAAGVWSPHPDKSTTTKEDDHHHLTSVHAVLKEGHRLIVLEYERQVPQESSTLTSSQAHHHEPPLQPSDHHPSTIIQEAEHKLMEAASLLPNLGQGVSTPVHHEATVDEELKEEPTATIHRAKDKICDAYGVCKEKVAELIGKSKEKVAHLEGGAKDAVANAAHKAKEVKQDLAGNLTEMADHALDGARSAAKKAREVRQNATQKAVVVQKNLTDIIRRGRDVIYDAAVYAGVAETADASMGVAHLLAFATAYGTCVWVTFVSSHVLARTLPRQQFGIVQSKLYPVYFRAMTYAVGVAFLAQFFGANGRRPSAAEKAQDYNLLTSLILVLANMLFLEPKATKVMFERLKMEKEEGRGRDMADVVTEPVVTGATTTTSSSAAATTTTTPPTYGARRRTTMATERAAVDQDHEVVKSRIVKLNRRLKGLNTYSSFLNVMALMGLTWHLVHLARRLRASC